MTECTDKDCPGCLALEFITKVHGQGLDPEDIVQLFFAGMNESFEGEIFIESIDEESRRGVIH